MSRATGRGGRSGRALTALHRGGSGTRRAGDGAGRVGVGRHGAVSGRDALAALATGATAAGVRPAAWGTPGSTSCTVSCRRPASRATSPRCHNSYAISSNWSGQVATGGTYTGVSANWIVPTVPDTSNLNNGTTEYSATWIGIDGTSSQSLIQTGTAQQSSGGPHYYAWYEAAARLPRCRSAGAVVRRGHHTGQRHRDVAERLGHQRHRQHPGMDLHRISSPTAHPAPRPSGSRRRRPSAAAWRPSTTTARPPSPAWPSPDRAPARPTYTPVYMADLQCAPRLISWPDTYTGTGSFTVHYGSPTPVITSVTRRPARPRAARSSPSRASTCSPPPTSASAVDPGHGVLPQPQRLA